MNASAPRQTALHSVHEALGAVFTDFGGWDMPLKYDNDLTEHQAVREAAGLFDLSHMGEVRITGPDAVALWTGPWSQPSARWPWAAPSTRPCPGRTAAWSMT